MGLPEILCRFGFAGDPVPGGPNPSPAIHETFAARGPSASLAPTPCTAAADIELSPSRGYAVDKGEQNSACDAGGACPLKAAFKVAPLSKRVARNLSSEFDTEAAV
jgi:hypothetical protein